MIEQNGYVDTIVVGAGLTGLSAAHRLLGAGQDFLLLEQSERVGGQIQTHREEGFVYESGPNTGIISTPEVAELFDDYPDLLQTAREEAKRRLILKDGKFHPLPSGLKSAISTSLFTWRDKLRILAEPFRPRGIDPDESIASLVRRRLGESYYRYAVDPFVGGIYAGDPERLVTRHALPKLYALEAKHGSFVRGAIALMRREKTEREQRATKQIFSARGGLSSLTEAIAERVAAEGRLVLNAQEIRVKKGEDGRYNIFYLLNGDLHQICCRNIITTIGTEHLCGMLNPLELDRLDAILKMPYAPIVQVALGYCVAPQIDFHAFGGLVPSCEYREVLGILNPSACFEGRCPEGGLLLSAFLGGMRCPELIDHSDEAIRQIVLGFLERSLGIKQQPDLLRIFRHRKAIPQYEADTDKRLDSISWIEHHYPGVYIGGNMLGGIGMPDRIKQGFELADRIIARQNR